MPLAQALPEPLSPPDGGELALDDVLRCTRLHAVMPARYCVLRQAANRRQRTTWNTNRGQAARFPSCAGCPQGAAVREALGKAGASITWKGAGAGEHYDCDRRGGVRAMLTARRRLELVGLLDTVPTLDEPPVEVDELEGGLRAP